jgi:hypothetical protein
VTDLRDQANKQKHKAGTPGQGEIRKRETKYVMFKFKTMGSREEQKKYKDNSLLYIVAIIINCLGTIFKV